MTPRSARRIDALHAEIAEIIRREKAKVRRINPPLNNLWLHVEEAKLDMFALCPQHRREMVEASATITQRPANKEQE